MELQERIITELQKEEEKVTGLSGRNRAFGIISLALIAFCAFWAISRQSPVDAQSAGAPATEFASSRAMEHLKVIAREPHPIGAAGHSAARDYILKALTGLGLNPEIQKSSVLNHRGDGPYVAASVQNIVGKIEGADHKQAILLTCHYDSKPSSPGASDDGAAVAAFLEVIRSLKTSPPLKNDVLFLFTDGEEIGSLGAKAFMDEHPAAKNVAVVLNFEARGVGGPSIMFETSEGNEWLVKEFAKAAARPVANSLTYDLYKLLGNDTDLSIFKGGGLRGLNFAYIMGHSYYHTARDSYENIDERSLQHHGSHALALARQFGNVSDWPGHVSNVIYFDLLSSVLVSYSEKWVLPLMTLILVLFVGLVTLGFRMRRLTLGGTAFAALGFLLNVVSVAALMIVVGLTIRGVSSDPTGGDYNDYLYAIGFLLLTVALSGALFVWFSKKTKLENLTVGALFWWAALLILICLRAPGGSYLLTWPLLLTLTAVGTIFILREEMTSAKSIVILTIPALSGVILIAPLIRLLMAGFGMGVLWMLMAFAVFPLALHYAHLNFLITIKKWLLPAASVLLGLCFIGAGILMSGVSKDNPRADHLFYALNADTGKAMWGSADQSPDEWTTQFFASGVERASLADYFPWGQGDFMKRDAPVVSLAPPSIVALDDTRRDGLRTLRLRVTSPRRAPALSIFWKRELRLEALVVNGKRVVEENFERTENPEMYRRFSYFGIPEEGIELALEIRSADSVELKVEEWSYGLPVMQDRPYAGRPDYIIPAPVLYSDCTVITKSVKF